MFNSFTVGTRTLTGYQDGIYQDASQDFHEVDLTVSVNPVVYKRQAKALTGSVAAKRTDPTGTVLGTSMLMVQFNIPKGFTEAEVHEQWDALVAFLTPAVFSEVLKGKS